MPDYSAFVRVPDAAERARLQEVMQAIVEKKAQLAQAEEQVRQAKAELDALLCRELPDLLDGLRLVEFDDGEGLVAKFEPVAPMALSQSRTAEAARWLAENGAAHVAVHVEFERESDAVAFTAACRKLWADRVSSSIRLDQRALQAVLDARLADGDDVPELFGVSRYRRARVEAAPRRAARRTSAG